MRECKVLVDPRVELASVVQLYAPWNKERRKIKEYIYLDDTLRAFGRWKNHEAVRCFTDLFYSGFSYDVLVGLMVHLSDPSLLKVTTELPKYIIGKAGSVESLKSFIESLRDFALKSNFMGFYKNHQCFYEDIITLSNLKEDIQGIIMVLEDFFQMSMWRYHIILTPLLEGNYGHFIKTSHGAEVFAFISPKEIVDGSPIFRSTTAVIEHEFMHAFVNPITEKFKNNVRKYSYLYKDLQSLSSIGYGDWETALNEFIIRACAIVIGSCYRGLKEEEITKWLCIEEMRGFKYIKLFYRAIRGYAKDRYKYGGFQEFYPKILKILDNLL